MFTRHMCNWPLFIYLLLLAGRVCSEAGDVSPFFSLHGIALVLYASTHVWSSSIPVEKKLHWLDECFRWLIEKLPKKQTSTRAVVGGRHEQATRVQFNFVSLRDKKYACLCLQSVFCVFVFSRYANTFFLISEKEPHMLRYNNVRTTGIYVSSDLAKHMMILCDLAYCF